MVAKRKLDSFFNEYGQSGRNIVKQCHQAGKPIGAVCIAPALMAAIFGEATPLKLTIGTDAQTAAAIEAMGANHHSCPVTEVVVDEENKLVTTPAYMLAQTITEVAQGVEKLVVEVLRMI